MIRQLAGEMADWCGRRQLARMRSAGFPAEYERAFEVLLGSEFREHECRRRGEIEAMRKEFARDEGATAGWSEAAFQPVGLGRGAFRTRTLLANVSSNSPLGGAFLNLCAEACGAEVILELGSSIGMSGCYLASSRCCRKFVSVEGTAGLARVAAVHLARMGAHAEVRHTDFDTFLEGDSGALGMVFIDGSKMREDNLRWTAKVLPRLRPGGLFLLDDIHWWGEMWECWKEIRQMRGFAWTVNAGRCGWGLWQGGTVEPRSWDLYSVAGLDLASVERWIARRQP